MARDKDKKREYNRKYREANKEKLKAYAEANRDKVKASHLKRRYGITPEQRDEILRSQGGVCAICKTDTPRGRCGTWNVDHCHDSGKVRGLLCWSCNTSIGKFKDNPVFLAEAINYLTR